MYVCMYYKGINIHLITCCACKRKGAKSIVFWIHIYTYKYIMYVCIYVCMCILCVHMYVCIYQSYTCI